MLTSDRGMCQSGGEDCFSGGLRGKPGQSRGEELYKNKENQRAGTLCLEKITRGKSQGHTWCMDAEGEEFILLEPVL